MVLHGKIAPTCSVAYFLGQCGTDVSRHTQGGILNRTEQDQKEGSTVLHGKIAPTIAFWGSSALEGLDSILLRGTIVNRTYGIHKNLYITPFLLTIFGAINYGPP